jgi:hypothetical protein
MTKSTINADVTVTALYFARGDSRRSYPKRIEFDGDTVNFIESGLQCLVRRGKEVVRIFTMSDGETQYRLRCDEAHARWTLMSIAR